MDWFSIANMTSYKMKYVITLYVVRLTDAPLAEKLQFDPELTLKIVITKARQSEMVK